MAWSVFRSNGKRNDDLLSSALEDVDFMPTPAYNLICLPDVGATLEGRQLIPFGKVRGVDAFRRGLI